MSIIITAKTVIDGNFVTKEPVPMLYFYKNRKNEKTQSKLKRLEL